MSTIVDLSLDTFTLNAIALKDLFQDINFKADNETADGAGGADRYKFWQAVKQGQEVSITSHWPGSGSNVGAVSLDVSVWQPYGEGGDQLANWKSGSLKVTIPTEDRSSGSTFNKFPVAVSGQDVEFTATNVIAVSADALALMMGGDIADMSVVTAITFNGEALEFNSLLSAAGHKIVKGKIQMQDTTVKIQGAPTDPTSDGTLLYIAMAGTGLVSLTSNTGGNTYATDEGQSLIITSYGLDWADGQITKETITLQVQGALAVTAP